MARHDKLYVVTRRDLSAGYQAVQAAHAAIEFIYAYPEVAQSWYTDSNYLVFLSASDQSELEHLMHIAVQQKVGYTAFFEPDLNHALTAVTFAPGKRSRALLRKIPLLLSELKSQKNNPVPIATSTEKCAGEGTSNTQKK